MRPDWVIIMAMLATIVLGAPPIKPLAGVRIVCSDGQTAITDSQGRYNITVTTPFTGTLTPVLNGYTFAPVRPSFTDVPSDAVMIQDFKAKKNKGNPFDALLKWLGIK